MPATDRPISGLAGSSTTQVANRRAMDPPTLPRPGARCFRGPFSRAIRDRTSPCIDRSQLGACVRPPRVFGGLFGLSTQLSC